MMTLCIYSILSDSIDPSYEEIKQYISDMLSFTLTTISGVHTLYYLFSFKDSIKIWPLDGGIY